MRVAVIGLARFGLSEPYAGGLECHVATLARALQAGGHRVTVFAGPGTAPAPKDLRVVPIVDHEPDMTGYTRIDNVNPPGRAEAEAAGYHHVLDHIDRGSFDVVHNASLHPVPVERGDVLAAPVLHALHTPRFDELETAHRRRLGRSPDRSMVVAVSRTLANEWLEFRPDVVDNGIDPLVWRPRRPANLRRQGAIWAGRIVPEKGLHLAIAAAGLAGLPLAIAGPTHDRGYYRDHIAPRLGADVRHLGHLTAPELARRYDRAAVGVVTPRWEEPFGLVAAEMLASGLPVAGFDRGALSSVVHPSVGRLAPADDVAALAAAMNDAVDLDRDRCRDHCLEYYSVESMTNRYLERYERLIAAVADGLKTSTIPTRWSLMSYDSQIAQDVLDVLAEWRDRFIEAADELRTAGRPDLMVALAALARQRASFHAELEGLAATYGEVVDESESIPVATSRSSSSGRDERTGHDTDGGLDVAERGEDETVTTYEEALSADISANLRQTLEQQLAEVEAIHDRVRTIGQAVKRSSPATTG